MTVRVFPSRDLANAAAAASLADWIASSPTCSVMVAGGKTPLALYAQIACQKRDLSHLNIFALDEYVGVPLDEPRNCANLLRQTVVQAWGVPQAQFFPISSLESDALASVQAQEQRIEKAGRLDIAILGLGQNGHLGFNEPGSAPHSPARVVSLDPVSIQANGEWFAGDHRPAKGATVGLRTILSARHILLMAYGSHKASAVCVMIDGPTSEKCPASFLQLHPDVHVFLDEAAGVDLSKSDEQHSLHDPRH